MEWTRAGDAWHAENVSLEVRDQRALDGVRDALASSLDLAEVIASASPLLLRLIPADYAALAVSQPGDATCLDWLVAEMPRRFFESYLEMVSHDFVLRAVLSTPGTVLRDAEMISRSDLESNFMYRRARDLGIPLEQVMATLLHVDSEWTSGLSLYRAERRPFSARDRTILQELLPALTHAVRNCRRFGAVQRRGQLVEALFAERGQAALVLKPPAREIVRTEAAIRLLEKWFPAHERRTGALPAPLLEQIRAWSDNPHAANPPPFTWSGTGGELLIRPHWISENGEVLLALLLEETQSACCAWRRLLTPREYQVAAKAVLGWDNELIAHELECKVGTVKKHLTRIFAKLGVDGRSQLIAHSLEVPKSEPERS